MDDTKDNATAEPSNPQPLAQAVEPEPLPTSSQPERSRPAIQAVGQAPVLNGTAAANAETTPTNNEGISADEIALYDRQIRLWGVQAQEKIRTANVLLIGLRGLGNEVAKNLVLSGIGSLTVVDDQLITEEDLGAQFLVSHDDVGKNRAEAAKPQLQALNPRVKLFTNTNSVMELLTNVEFFKQFTIVVATDLTVDILQALNAASRLCLKPFYAASTYGMYGYIFADLIQHTFIIEREKSNMTTAVGPETVTRSVVSTATKKSDNGKTIELVTKTEQYSPLSDVLNALLPTDRISTRRRKLQITPILACIKALWSFQINTARPYPSETSNEDLATFTQLATEWHKTYLQLPPETLRSGTLRQFLQGITTEISPICAMLGGALAQNVTSVIGQNEQPFQNLLIWDGEEITGEIYAMHPLAPTLLPALGTQIAPQMMSNPGAMQSGGGVPTANGNGVANGVA